MPPRPIDNAHVYQKTLHAARMADEYLHRAEKHSHLHLRLTTEELEQRQRRRIELEREGDPLRRVGEDDQEEARRRRQRQREKHNEAMGHKQDGDDPDSPDRYDEHGDPHNDLRRRRPEDDEGKGDSLDVRG